MCGILGFYKPFDDSKTPTNFTDALMVASERGDDATGFWAPTTGLVKDGCGADKFVNKYASALKKGMRSKFLIAHTRGTSSSGRHYVKAPAENNANNHPFEGKRYVMVHNGKFSNLPDIKHYKYDGHCDSELALSYFETFGVEKALTMFHKNDAFAIVVYDKQEKILYFLRHGNPLTYGWLPSERTWVFASTIDIACSAGEWISNGFSEQWSMLTPLDFIEDKLYTVKNNKLLCSEHKLKFRQTVYELVEMDKDKITEADKEYESLGGNHYKHQKTHTPYDDDEYLPFYNHSTRESAPKLKFKSIIKTCISNGSIKHHLFTLREEQATSALMRIN